MNINEEERKRQRGIRAAQLLGDELVKEAFNDIRANLYRKIESSNFDQSDDRENCYYMLRAVESLEGIFKKHIQEGRISEEHLKRPPIVKRVQEL